MFYINALCFAYTAHAIRALIEQSHCCCFNTGPDSSCSIKTACAFSKREIRMHT
jgi:hypothetical protein